MAAVLYYKPQRPYHYMASALQAVQTHRDSGEQFDALELFHEVARKANEEAAPAAASAPVVKVSISSPPPMPSSPVTSSTPTRLGDSPVRAGHEKGEGGKPKAVIW